MALGTALAVGAAVGGSILSSKSQKKAANKAADTSLAVAEKNNALAREVYGENKSALSPYMQRGNAAGDMINALLGIPGATPAPAATSPAASQPTYGNGNGLLNLLDRYNGAKAGNGWGEAMPDDPYGYQTGYAAAAAPAPAANALDPAKAFDIYRNSTGYQFRLGQGTDAINTGYAAQGLLQSGAAQKALQRYGQDYASNEFGNYIGYLSNQQGVGLGGASALAGVGNNYVSNVSANNNSAGSAAANAALIKGQANANMWQSIAGGIGNAFGSSFG